MRRVPRDVAVNGQHSIAELGLRTSQMILNASNPLSVLKRVSQDFPKYALALGRKPKYTVELYEELASNQQRVGGGVSMLWLNGMIVQETDLNPFKFVSCPLLSSQCSCAVQAAEHLAERTHAHALIDIDRLERTAGSESYHQPRHRPGPVRVGRDGRRVRCE